MVYELMRGKRDEMRWVLETDAGVRAQLRVNKCDFYGARGMLAYPCFDLPSDLFHIDVLPHSKLVT